MEKSKIIGKNALNGFLGILPLGSVASAIIDSIVEINESENSEKAQQDLQNILTNLIERIVYLEENSDESSDEISFEFNRGLNNDEYNQFVEKFKESDIPLDTADMYDGNIGMNIHLDECVSGFEIYKAKEKMNELLKGINSDLEVVE